MLLSTIRYTVILHRLGMVPHRFAHIGDQLTFGRYIWQMLANADTKDDDPTPFSDLQRRIVKCCEEAWTIVRHVLCDDSPEGHLPEEMEDIEGLDTKDLLSYSFRAIHESRYGP